MVMRLQTDNIKALLIELAKLPNPVIALSAAGYQDLVATSFNGREEAAIVWLVKLVNKHQKPLIVNNVLYSAVISPSSWTKEKALGYIAGHHESIEEVFGEIHFIE